MGPAAWMQDGVKSHAECLNEPPLFSQSAHAAEELEVVRGRVLFLFLGFLGIGGFRGMVVVVHGWVDEMIVRR